MKVFEYTRASLEHPERCEDAILTFNERDNAPVFAVIDGMGGHQRVMADGRRLTGRDASQAIREVFIEDLEHFPPDVSADPGAEVEVRTKEVIQRAHHDVFNGLNGGPDIPIHERVGAVATVVVACEGGQRLFVAQVGDTRAYLYTEGELIQLCEDEDNVEFLVKQGRLSQKDAELVSEIINNWDGVGEPEVKGGIRIGAETYDAYLAWRWFVTGNAALRIPGANVVINSLGTEADDLEIQVSRIEVLPGDKLLLCSDGLYKNLSHGEIIEKLANADDPATALGEMAYARSQDTLNRRMNPDDISVIVVQL
jgi:protein phosphatase